MAEDAYAADVAQSYAQFVHVRPFYEFSFAAALRGLWHVPFRATHLTRTLERRAWLTVDYAIEALYCEIIELGTHATYGFEDTSTSAWVEFPPEKLAGILGADPHITVARSLSPGAAILEVPRYQEFTPAAQALIASGAHFHQIAGNEIVTLSVISRGPLPAEPGDPQVLLAQTIPSDAARTRSLLLCPVGSLDTLLPALASQGVVVEHLYDF